MALFGGYRDINLFRGLNNELLGNIVNQQCSVYKHKVEEVKVNMYGEVTSGRMFNGPYLFNTLIERGDQNQTIDEFGNSFIQDIEFRFLKEDLIKTSIILEVGDIIMYNDNYYEVDNVNDNQFFIGKNQNYPNNPNPLNPGLERFGWDVSIIVSAHNIPGDKYNISKERII